MAFYKFSPAIRIVNSVGTPTVGPLALYLPNALTQGIILRETTCEYAQELLGTWLNLQYGKRWRLLGYRPIVTLDLVLIADGASGLANLWSYYTAAMQSETYAALQFNLFSATDTTWRGMVPTTPWSPRPIGGKQRTGYELSFGLEARDLITTPGDWSTGTW